MEQEIGLYRSWSTCLKRNASGHASIASCLILSQMIYTVKLLSSIQLYKSIRKRTEQCTYVDSAVSTMTHSWKELQEVQPGNHATV